MTIGLLLVSAAVFLWELHLDPHARHLLFQTFGVVPVNPAWVATVTSLFVHDGWIQFASNMACLWIFGDNVEDTMGASPSCSSTSRPRSSRLSCTSRCTPRP